MRTSIFKTAEFREAKRKRELALIEKSQTSCTCHGKKLKITPAVPKKRRGKIKDRLTHRIDGPIALVQETNKAYGFRLKPTDTELFWVPNRQLISTEGEDDSLAFIVITEWWAIKKGIYEKPDYSSYEVGRGSAAAYGYRYDRDDEGEHYPNEY
jgi:hypothetical protein